MNLQGRKLLRLTVAIICLLAIMPTLILAGSTGKIKGQVTDKKTGEPLVGVSIQIKGTTIGTYTDIDGYYIINRVDPGTYELLISTMGYGKIEIEKVEVKIDVTSEQNAELSSAVTDIGKTIRVSSKRDILDKFETSSTEIIGQEAISTKPVQNVDQILQQVSGVRVTAGGEVFVRGGRSGEVSYILDGVPISDPLGGIGQSGANISLVSGSIQEIQIIKDGFDPEYGNALSGIVNIRSQTGSKNNTRINLYYLTDDLGTSKLNKFSRDYDNFRFSVSGPDPILKNKILPALGLNFLADKELTYFIYAEGTKHNGVFQYDAFDSPNTRARQANYSLLGFDIPDRLSNSYSFQANFRFRPQPNLKFVVSYKKWFSDITSFNWSYRYSSATAPITNRDRTSMSIEVTQQVTKNMSYEAIFSITEFEFSQRPGDPNNPGVGLDPDDFRLQSEWESWADANGNGVYDAPEPLINLFPDTATYGSGFAGGAYNSGEYYDVNGNGFFDSEDFPLFLPNNQGGGIIFGNFRFNDNGIFDNLEGEAFVDLNGNGVWDRGEFLNDKNGNGKLDADRLSPINNRDPEPYVDGDSVLGEPFIDLNRNNTYDVGIDRFIIAVDPATNQDLNHNGKYDGPGNPFSWTAGIPYLDRNGNGVYDLPNSTYDPGEPFVDRNQNGKYDYGGNSSFLNPLQFDVDALWHRRSTRTHRGEVKLFRQMGKHELKAGIAITRDQIKFEEITRPYLPYTGRPDGPIDPITGSSLPGPFGDRGAFRDFYSYTPWSGTFYGRDKLEYGSMIASLGLRWDFFLQDVDNLARTLKNDDRGGLIEGDRQKLSPRIGFSYPISDKAKVYFNYGHFFQLPPFSQLYARNTSSVDQDDIQGYPNLDYQKTIQYSFGVKYKMAQDYTIDIQGYFKDEFDKVNSLRVLEGFIFRQAYRNRDYGRSRGFELTLEKRSGGNVNGRVSYAYAFAFGKASQTNDRFLEDFLLSREPLSEAALDIDIRHSLKAGITFFMPTTSKPRLFGIPIPNGWTMTIEAIVESGAPFTPSKSFPDIDQTGAEDIERNSLRLPATAVFDIRFSKEFVLAGIDWNYIFWVENVLDSRNVLGVYSSTGRPDTDQNTDQVILGGTDFQNNPNNLDYGRQIRMGLEMTL